MYVILVLSVSPCSNQYIVDSELRRDTIQNRLICNINWGTSMSTCCQSGKELQRQYLVAAYTSYRPSGADHPEAPFRFTLVCIVPVSSDRCAQLWASSLVESMLIQFHKFSIFPPSEGSQASRHPFRATNFYDSSNILSSSSFTKPFYLQHTSSCEYYTTLLDTCQADGD